MEKKRRRRGDRKDGRRLRSVDPILMVEPFIMKDRNDALIMFSDSVETGAAEAFLRKKKDAGMKNISMLYMFLAAYVRVVANRPAINRFVSGQRLFSRNNIEIVMAVKKELSLESPETMIKVIFEPTDTIDDVYNKFNAAVVQNKDEDNNSNFDKAAKFFMGLPRPILNFTFRIIRSLDYHGHLPKFLLDLSPFHGSLIVTSMGSLGIPPVYHHIYNFGNLPAFLAYGAKRSQMVLDADGNLEKKSYIDFKVEVDERICDGYYFASAFKLMKRFIKNPEMLDVPPEKVLQDVE